MVWCRWIQRQLCILSGHCCSKAWTAGNAYDAKRQRLAAWSLIRRGAVVALLPALYRVVAPIQHAK